MTIVNSRIRIGCAGWNIPREFAHFFPAEGTHLQRYSRVMNCVEVNSSFYRPHKPKTWERWAEAVPDDFCFSVKAPRTITHEAALNCNRQTLKDFFEQLEGLGPKLGPVLFQFPPKLQFDSVRAKDFLSLLRTEFSGNIVWEPRHKSWFEPAAEELLVHFRVSRVAADPGCVDDASLPGGWDTLSYYRLHGSPRKYYSSYSSDSLRNLASRISVSPMTVWCVFDNTASGAAVGNAIELTGYV